MEALLGYEVVQVSCGASHVLAVTNEHEVFAWGRGDNGLSVSVCVCPSLCALSSSIAVGRGGWEVHESLRCVHIMFADSSSFGVCVCIFVYVFVYLCVFVCICVCVCVCVFV